MSKKQNLLKSIMTFLSEDDKPKETVNLAQEVLDNGTNVEAEEFVAEQPIFIITDEGDKVPLPVGEYEWKGKLIVILEDGIIAEVKDIASEETEEDLGAEYVTKEEFNNFVNEIKQHLSKAIKEDLSKEEKETKALETLSKDLADLKKQVDEIPDAQTINVAPKDVQVDFSKMTELQKRQWYRKNG